MNNEIYDTGNLPATQNPQGSSPVPGASNGADFQSTATNDALNSQTDNLSVQETGEPVTGAPAENSSGLDIPLGWSILIAVAIVVAVIAVVKIIKDIINEDKSYSSAATKPKAVAKSTSSSKKTATKKPSKAVSRKGKKKTTKKTKKRK